MSYKIENNKPKDHLMHRSLSDGASSYQRKLSGTESVTRPRSLEADNVLNSDHTPRPEKGDTWPCVTGMSGVQCW